MRVLPLQETQAERVLREIAGVPKERALLGFLAREKRYVMPELADQGYSLSWNLDGQIINQSLKELWDRNRDFDFIKAGRLWIPDKMLGRIRSIFHYNGSEQLFLDYSPKFLRWGCSEELPRKNVPLRKNEKDKDLRVPYGYYLLTSR